jgi:hypothetical protein
VRDDQVAAFVLMHDLGLWADRQMILCSGKSQGAPPPAGTFNHNFTTSCKYFAMRGLRVGVQ